MAPCSKIRYATLAAAAQALRPLLRAHHGEVALHPCVTCRGFHLTSDRKSANNKWTRMGFRQLSQQAI